MQGIENCQIMPNESGSTLVTSLGFSGFVEQIQFCGIMPSTRRGWKKEKRLKEGRRMDADAAPLFLTS